MLIGGQTLAVVMAYSAKEIDTVYLRDADGERLGELC